MTTITLPHDWKCRAYQAPLWRYLNGGGKRAVAVWHRRAGKDQVGLHWSSVASQRRVGVYWHMLPTLRQARKVVWENIDGDGRRVMDAWPGWDRPGQLNDRGEPTGLVKHIRNDEMKVELWNGSIWYAAGSDNYDSLMGTNPVGVIFSEWALTNPAAWDYLRPILSENGGWALFIYTPRGRNHGASLYDMAQENPDWFCQKLTVDDTQAISAEAIHDERKAGMAEELIQQEFWCSFDAPLVGSFWGRQLIECEQQKRITSVPHDPALKVMTWWDLGHSDATAIWFIQLAGNEIHIVDYYEANGEPLEHYAFALESMRLERKFVYGRHIWPHDGGAKTLASKGRQLNEMFGDLGYSAEVQPRHVPEVAIQRVRQILSRCWFDDAYRAPESFKANVQSPAGRRGVQHGLDALRAFRKQLDEDKSTDARPYFKPGYVHDWSSHGASAFYTGSMVLYDANAARVKPAERKRYQDGARRASHWAA